MKNPDVITEANPDEKQEALFAQVAEIVAAIAQSEGLAEGTLKSYEQSLRQAALILDRNDESLLTLSPYLAHDYLLHRSSRVSKPQLIVDRLALQRMMWFVTHTLPLDEKLPIVDSTKQAKESPSLEALKAELSVDLIERIASFQTEHNALSTYIIAATGLRPHELGTLLPIAERSPDAVMEVHAKHLGRGQPNYTVIGRKGIVRSIVLPAALADDLEHQRCEPVSFTDRGVTQTRHYNIGTGSSWSSSLSRAASNLGWAGNAEVFRAAYAETRLQELNELQRDEEEALAIIGAELGNIHTDSTKKLLQ